MDDNVIFIKTEKAQQEIKKKTDQISLKTRFVLILIDGIHSVGQLQEAHSKRFGNIVPFLEELLSKGYIESKAEKLSTVISQKEDLNQPPSQSASQGIDVEKLPLENKKSAIGDLLTKIYGTMAVALLSQLNTCQTENELYAYTKELYDVIVEGFNKRKAEDFWSQAAVILEN